MAIPDNIQAALTRLSGGYNNGDYNASTNPLGFSNGGHRINLYALTADFVLVGAWYEGLSEPINGITSEIEALGAVVAQIQTLAAIDDDISTLAAIHAAVSTAAGIAANITTVAGIAANVTTVAGIAANVTTTAGIAAAVSTVAGIDDDVAQVSTIHGDVTQVSTIHTDVSNVSTIKDDVTAVSGIKTDVSQVSSIHAAVSTAASDSADISTVASDSADIRTLADLQDGTVATHAISDLADIKDDITAAVGNATDISAVAADLTNIDTVATNVANVNKVAAVDDEVAAVAAVDDEVAAVAGIAANVTTVAGIAAAVSSVAADTTNINAVAADLAHVDTVAGIAADVTDVAGIATNVTTVAANDADVTTVASNIADVNTVAGVATEIATVAPIAADVTAVANVDIAVTTVSGIAANVSTVAGIAAAVTTTAGIASDVTAVATIGGADIATVAGAAADIATAATNIVAIQGAAGAASDAADARDAAEAYATTTKALTLRFTFSNATSDADPGSGKIAFNNATPASVTALYISTSEANGGDVTDWLARFDASTNLNDRGEITFVKDTAPGTWAKFVVNDATTTATGYRKIAVAYVAHAGTWTDGDSFGVSFARSGDAGHDGEGAGNVNYVSTTPTEGRLIAAGGSSNTIKDGGVSVSTDGTLAGNSDVSLPTEKAVKTKIDALAATLGTAATKDTGTSSGNVPVLDGSGKLDAAVIPTAPVTSVNSKTGAVTLNPDDLDDTSTTNKFASAARVASLIHAANGKTTPVDADEVGLIDSAASNVLKKLTWANIKAALIAAFKASASAVWTGTSDASFVTPKSLYDSGAAQAFPAVTGTVTLDFGAGLNWADTITGNITLANPTNQKAGQSGVIEITQDGTGSRTIALGTDWKFAGGAPALSTAAGAVDLISYWVKANGTIRATIGKGFA